MRTPLTLALLTVVLLGSVSAHAESAGPIKATPLEWSLRMADSEIARKGDSLAYKPGGGAKWDYANSIVALGCLKLAERTGGMRYAAFAGETIGSFLNADGEITTFKMEDYNIDNVRPGVTALALYRWTGEERYRKAADILRLQLDRHPRTHDGGFWHKLRYPHQMWLDGLYMGGPFYAQYTAWFGKPEAFDDIATQFLLIAKHTYDPKSGLFYHAWDESKKMPWADKTTGASPGFWSRAIGWYAMALVDTLEFFPADHPARPEMVEWFRKLAAGVVKHQDPASGLWWQVTDQGARKGNYLEASASSMFVYALAKGVNAGLLSHDFDAPIRAGYAGIVRDLVRADPDGRIDLTQCCRVAGLDAGRRDGTFDYYTLREPIVRNDAKGVGPFLLAGLELDKLFGAEAVFEGGKSVASGWDQVPAILARIVPPKFPERDFPIVDFGAVPGGKTDSTEAIRRAVQACHAAGGGRVVVPAGEFLTGPIHLLSNVNLHVAEGATLLFSTDPAAYPNVPTRWEGVECLNYSPLIYAFGQENIAVTGTGTLDGQAGYANWWGWVCRSATEKAVPNLATTDRKRLMEFGETDAPTAGRVFGVGHYLRPNFIQPNRCRNVLIEGVTIVRAPMWVIHPLVCTNVTVRGVTVRSPGPNNDGCDPESCRDVLIEGCTFQTGDDCIAIKSGRNHDGRRVGAPAENIVVRRCMMRDGHGGVTIGSEISADCRNVYVEDCNMDSPDLDRALRIKSNAMRGGTIENVHARNIAVGRVSDAVISINFRYEEADKGPFTPVVRNVVVENLTSASSRHALSLIGLDKAPIRDIRLTNCTFSGVTREDVIEHVEGLKKRNVTVTWTGEP